MRASGQRALFIAACLVGLGTGVFLGSGQRLVDASVPGDLQDVGSARSASPGPSGDLVPASDSTVGREVLLRRNLAACETTALWHWLEQDPERDETRLAVVRELVDRLGWAAWTHALAIGDRKLRERLGDAILYEQARRDPWKAFAEWQAHREIFLSKEAGAGVIAECTLAAAAISADKVIEMFQQISQEEPQFEMGVEYAKDFDFRKVLDFLVTAEKQPYTEIGRLMPEWAKRAPVEAAEWLADHPEYLAKEYYEGAAGETLRAIAETEMDDSTRQEALEAMAKLRPEDQQQAWQSLGESSDGKIQASVLQTAELGGQREEFLRAALEETRTFDEIDTSWQQVPLAERVEILDKLQQEWAETERSAVDAKSQAHWLRVVKKSWGITP